jgi:hypothetical protein
MLDKAHLRGTYVACTAAGNTQHQFRNISGNLNVIQLRVLRKVAKGTFLHVAKKPLAANSVYEFASLDHSRITYSL